MFLSTLKLNRFFYAKITGMKTSRNEANLYRLPLVLISAVAIGFSSALAQSEKSWVNIGPAPMEKGQVENLIDENNVATNEVSGAIQSIAPHPTDEKILYVGAVNGGVWRSGNASDSDIKWERRSEGLTSLSIGALAVDPSDHTGNTVLAGNAAGSSYWGFSTGRHGLWRTTDGGKEWKRIDANKMQDMDITEIVARGRIIVVATKLNGLWRTDNPEDGWPEDGWLELSSESVGDPITPAVPSHEIWDLQPSRTDRNLLYLVAGGEGIFNSHDTGETWDKISDTSVGNKFNGTTITVSNALMSVGPDETIFLGIVAKKPVPGESYSAHRLESLFRGHEERRGWIWEELDVPPIHTGKTGQGDTHFSLVADPTDKNIVYVGGNLNEKYVGTSGWVGNITRVDASKATGNQASSIIYDGAKEKSAPHGDSRDMEFITATGNLAGNLIEASDGGIVRRTDPKTATGQWYSMNGNISITEFHNGAWDSVSDTVVAGAQDNGVSEQKNPGDETWKVLLKGDGGDVAVDDSQNTKSHRYIANNSLIRFRQLTYSAAGKSTTTQKKSVWVKAEKRGISGTGFFVTPLAINSVKPERILIPTETGIYESIDHGTTAVKRSNAEVNHNKSEDPIAYGAGSNADVVYVGIGDKLLIRSTGGNIPTTQYDPSSSDRSQIVDIFLKDDQKAYVLSERGIYFTENAGGNWRPLTGDLHLQIPGTFRSLAFCDGCANETLIVGADNGVFAASTPEFSKWSPIGKDQPTAPVFDLDYSSKDDVLIALTLGAGAWQLEMN